MAAPATSTWCRGPAPCMGESKVSAPNLVFRELDGQKASGCRGWVMQQRQRFSGAARSIILPAPNGECTSLCCFQQLLLPGGVFNVTVARLTFLQLFAGARKLAPDFVPSTGRKLQPLVAGTSFLSSSDNVGSATFECILRATPSFFLFKFMHASGLGPLSTSTISSFKWV
uniref:Uncharacterized protein n=1 Tax=Trypanosoma congolense (strain IL3000) TaxID=1068625 RepID=G0UT05_TRYCI|nr:hypothetical protein TCIL3000_8_7470 [Trypanosoma congolense IL3000]